MQRSALPKEQVVRAIERRGGVARVPMMLHFWNGPDGYGDRADLVRAIQADFPQDMYSVSPRMPSLWDDPAAKGHIPGYSWMATPPPAGGTAAKGHDANICISDWAMLDDILAAWPDANLPQLTQGLNELIAANAAGRYVTAHWWYCLYERLWSLRGMENVLMDFYLNPAPVHRLLDALTDFYCAIIRRLAREAKVDGIFTSDDIGMQTGPMFSPEIFAQFFRPRYERIIRTAHEEGLHFWLHACGDISLFLEDFIAMGLDVIHPIQKYAMDMDATARRFGGRIAFWVGMDVQQILPRGTTEEVRRETRRMIDAFDRTGGGCLVTAGNGITGDVPLENLRAFYEETYEYGLSHRKRFA